MEGFDADLQAYYEEEARRQLRKPQTGRRVELRIEFLKLVNDEGRRSVIDFGAGPGFEGVAFVQAGKHYLGLDLSVGNARLAQSQLLNVLPASIKNPPIRPRSFDAGWSMSTLMHLPDEHVLGCLEAMASTLRPGAPLCIGQWGGQGEAYVDTTIEGQKRFFGLRSFALNQQLISKIGSIEKAEVWFAGNDEEYHVITVRIPAWGETSY